MTRKVIRIKYNPLAKKVEFHHNDGTITVYTELTVPSRVRIEWLPYRYLTSFMSTWNEVLIYIHKEKIKINWQ